MSRETRWFAGAAGVALLHALDDAFIHRGPGLGLGQHVLAGLLALAIGVGGVAMFARLRSGLRAGLAFSFGCLALVNGALHLGHVRADGLAAGDVTGLLAAVAGIVLIGLAGAIVWRHRGRGSWRSRTVAILGGFLAALFVLGPIAMGIGSAHKWREPIGRPPSDAYEEVTFRASDGLRISGWYVASHNGAAIVVLHGGGSDRTGSLAHARLLARHGYGVLLYDARGRGRSEGSPNDYGWDWAKDLNGALGFLKRRPDVDPARIGALGISTGADVLLDAAAGRRDIAAIVTDGAAAGSFADWRNLRGANPLAIPGWMMFATIRVLSGDSPGHPLERQVRRIAAPTLLISAGTDVEREFNELYARAARGRLEHWNVPDAQHTRAIRSHPKRYEQRVVGFFDDALARAVTGGIG